MLDINSTRSELAFYEIIVFISKSNAIISYVTYDMLCKLDSTLTSLIYGLTCLYDCNDTNGKMFWPSKGNSNQNLDGFD